MQSPHYLRSRIAVLATLLAASTGCAARSKPEGAPLTDGTVIELTPSAVKQFANSAHTL